MNNEHNRRPPPSEQASLGAGAGYHVLARSSLNERVRGTDITMKILFGREAASPATLTSTALATCRKRQVKKVAANPGQVLPPHMCHKCSVLINPRKFTVKMEFFAHFRGIFKVQVDA